MNTEISEARKCAEELGPLTLSSWSKQKALMLPVMEEIIQKYMDAEHAKVRESDKWLIFYEDEDHQTEIFVGEGAKEAAIETFKQRSVSWSCYLFRSIDAAITKEGVKS